MHLARQEIEVPGVDDLDTSDEDEENDEQNDEQNNSEEEYQGRKANQTQTWAKNAKMDSGHSGDATNQVYLQNDRRASVPLNAIIKANKIIRAEKKSNLSWGDQKGDEVPSTSPISVANETMSRSLRRASQSWFWGREKQYRQINQRPSVAGATNMNASPRYLALQSMLSSSALNIPHIFRISVSLLVFLLSFSFIYTLVLLNRYGDSTVNINGANKRIHLATKIRRISQELIVSDSERHIPRFRQSLMKVRNLFS